MHLHWLCVPLRGFSPRAPRSLGLALLATVALGCGIEARAALPSVRLRARITAATHRVDARLVWSTSSLAPLPEPLAEPLTPRPLELAGRVECAEAALCAWERRAVARALQQHSRWSER